MAVSLQVNLFVLANNCRYVGGIVGCVAGWQLLLQMRDGACVEKRCHRSIDTCVTVLRTATDDAARPRARRPDDDDHGDDATAGMNSFKCFSFSHIVTVFSE